MPIALTGTAVSPGTAIGKARVQQHGQLDIVEYTLPERFLNDEIARLHQALASARQQLYAIRASIPDKTPQDIAVFIDTHLLMLDDSAFSKVPEAIIRQRHCNAEWALKLQQDALVQVFDAMDDPYLRTRRDDVEHVVRRIQQILLKAEHSPAIPEGEDDEPQILIAVDLTPSDMVLLQHHHIAAIVTERGGPLSHTAILARSLGIPALVGVSHAHHYVHDGEMLVVDAHHGSLLCGVDTSMLKVFRRQQKAERRIRRSLDKLRDEPALSLDGIEITLHANIELSEDIRAMHRVGASGVGLYRTEYLFMNRDTPPDEEEQYQSYRHTIKRLKGAPLTIRSLDVGADKEIVPGASTATNPALGLRAVRLCLSEQELFVAQLRAILRASAHGPVRLLIPMLTNSQEIHQVLDLLKQVQEQLRAENKAYDPAMPLGAMIEVPASALCTDIFARHFDFLSIGTNDLMQYTLATDRIDETVNHLFDPLNPGVLRLIDMTIKAAAKTLTPISMCGEMAGDPEHTRLLLALGLREFSAPPNSLPAVKQVIRQSHIGKLQKQLGKSLYSDKPERIAARLVKIRELKFKDR
jgi:phosphoenolpyruvate-protein phosphotransferase (PTS system enzyme I)